MQIPPVSLDSPLPAANAAAPPATDGGGFARSLRERQDLLAAPAADSAAQSPEQVKTIAARRDGEPRQGADDHGAELEEKGASLAKEEARPSPRRGAKAGSGDVLRSAAMDPARILAEMAVSPEVPAPTPAGVVAEVPAALPPKGEVPSPALPLVSGPDAEAFPEASAQGAPVQPLPAPSLPDAEKVPLRMDSPDESSTVLGAVPEIDARASLGNPRIPVVPRGEDVASSVFGSDPASSPISDSTPAPTPISTDAVETPDAPSPEPDRRVAAGVAPVREGRGTASSLSTLPAQEAADPAATRVAEIPRTRGAMTDPALSAAAPREPFFAAAASLGPGPETPAARTDVPAVAPGIGGVPSSAQGASSAVIDSVRVTPGQSQPVSLSPQAATGIAALAEGLAPLRETVVPPRLREDLRGQRLDTSSDRRFAQLLGETRGALRIPVAAGESLPVTDVVKGEGAELLFRAPGAQGEPAIFRVSTDNGSNSQVFSAFGQGAATPQAASSGSGTASAAVPFTLPVPEEQVYQQVASRLTLVGGERHSRMTMRLYPEELGQVKLDLTVEGDRVRLHLHAQNQQVQEVLEKYLPRLRESFEQQGLKLEDAQVTSDSPGQGGRGSFQESRQSFFAARSSGRSAGRTAGEEEPVVSPPPTPANPRPGSISLRV